MASRKKAVDGIADLIDRTGGGVVRAAVKVNQPYAQDQHETMWYRHPRGGRAKYLEGPLFENYNKWIQQFADKLLTRGREAEREWGGVGRKLADAVGKNAPVEFGDLKRSAGLLVKISARVVIDEPPLQGRLSEQELDAKDYMRHAGQGYRE